MSKTQNTHYSSLDTTSVTKQKSVSTYREYISTENTIAEYDAVVELYEKLWKDYQLERLSECRSQAFFVRELETGLVKVLSKSCHVKFCPYCTKSRSFLIKQNTAKWLKACNHPKFITLTLRHSEETLLEQLDHLYSAFRELRRLKLWKSKIIGGIWFFEIKFAKSGKWHPHIHLVADGEYIPQRKLSRNWEKVTWGSPICDIRSVKDPKKVADYVAKYATKPCSLRYLAMSQRIELYEALKRRRLVGTFGTAHKAKLTSKPKTDENNFINIGSWTTVLNLRECDENARKIWFAYSTKHKIDKQISCKLIDDFITGKEPPDQTRFKTIIKEKCLW